MSVIIFSEFFCELNVPQIFLGTPRFFLSNFCQKIWNFSNKILIPPDIFFYKLNAPKIIFSTPSFFSKKSAVFSKKQLIPARYFYKGIISFSVKKKISEIRVGGGEEGMGKESPGIPSGTHTGYPRTSTV